VITRDTVVVKVPPRITAAKFEEVLKTAKSPAATEAREIYRVIVENGTDPAFALALFKHESQYATDPKSMVVLHSTKNWGNTRSSRVGVKTIAPTERGNFVSYGTWAQGADDATYRLIDPEFEYARAGATTIGEIIPIWAPGTDGNDPAGYINTVISLMNQWIGDANTTMKDPTNQVNLIPGHAGRGRGGIRPKLIVCHIQEGSNDLYQEFLNRPAGNQADCTIWSKQDGTLVRLLNDSDTPWTNGDVVDPDMNNSIIAGMVLAGVGNTNAYSYTIEHQGFASKGFSDAQVESTAKMCAYWCFINGWQPSRERIVGHYQVGAHKNCPGPLFPFDKVVARAKELLGGSNVTPTYDPCMEYFNAHGGEAVFGKPVGGQYGTSGSVERMFSLAHMWLNKTTGKVEVEMRDPNIVVKNGFQLGHGMLDYWNKFDLPGVPHPLGLPLSNEKDWTSPDGKKFVIQVFERAVLGYDGSIADPDYRVQGLLIGHDWLQNHKS
jgi:hypothetical protein